MSFEQERSAAIEAVQKACQLCQTVQAELVTEETVAKKDKSPVTIADFGAQAIVNQHLLNVFPNDPIVAEEDAHILREPDAALMKERIIHHVHTFWPGASEEQILISIDRGNYEGGPQGRHWTLDPIDGTKGFIRGDQYAIALGLIENGEVVLGALGCPNLPLQADKPDGAKGCILIAVKGQGAFIRSLEDDSETPIHVSEIADVSQASFCESVESGHTSHSRSSQIAEALGVTAPPYRIDSQCKYAAVARGDASIYLRLPTSPTYQEKIWDHAAGSIVVKEAGGKVTDIHGAPLNFARGKTFEPNTGIVATCGSFHSQVIDAVKRSYEQ